MMSVFDHFNPQVLHPNLHRKLSETSGTCSPSMDGPSVATMIPAKPCLKRRCSVPAPTSSDLGSMESLDSRSSSSSGLYGSFSSRKSVSFADSIGEDLCRIKLFEKDLFEEEEAYYGQGHLWRRWWTDEEQDFDFDFEESLDEVEEIFAVIAEEDEDEMEEEEEEEADILTMTNLDKRLERSKSDSRLTASCDRGEVASTFVSPQDLPDFSDRLCERGICLENVSVVTDEARRLVSGTIRLCPCLDNSDNVQVTYSFDNWNSSTSVSATNFRAKERFGFVVDVSRMQIGEDMEMTVRCRGADNKVIQDDNNGLKYRFICKNKPKFRPGKSLW